MIETQTSDISWKKVILDFFLAWLIVWIILNYVFSVAIVPTSSMSPTIQANSLIFSWRLPYLFGNPTPDRGEIVSFKHKGTYIIKRVIGLPGDTIEIKDGNVYVNGDLLNETYILEPQSTLANAETQKTIFEVPENSIFVLGDNRSHSADSRYMESPFVPISDIISEHLFSIHLSFLR